jgi:uncharacterized protein
MTLSPFTLDELHEYLSSDTAPDDCMQVSDIDAFLTALIVGPAFIHPEVWLPVIWGIGNPKFRGPHLMDRAIAAITARCNEISAQLADRPDRFAPLYWRKDDGTVIAADWAEGFLDAMELNLRPWAELLASDHHRHLLFPILVHCGDKNGHSLLGLSRDQEEILLASAYHHIPEAVIGIREFFMPMRVAAAKEAASEDKPAPHRHTKKRRQ